MSRSPERLAWPIPIRRSIERRESLFEISSARPMCFHVNASNWSRTTGCQNCPQGASDEMLASTRPPCWGRFRLIGKERCRLLRRPIWHQKSFVRTTCSAVVGKSLKVRTAARLYETQSHRVAACDAWHLNGDLKARAGRRWAWDLHCILILKRGTQRYR